MGVNSANDLSTGHAGWRVSIGERSYQPPATVAVTNRGSKVMHLLASGSVLSASARKQLCIAMIATALSCSPQ